MLAQRMALLTMTSSMAILKATMMRGTLVSTITIVASILMVPHEEDLTSLLAWQLMTNRPYDILDMCVEVPYAPGQT